MTSWERIRRVLDRRLPDRAPFRFNLCPAQVDVCEAMTGTRDYAARFGFDLKTGGPGPSELKHDYSVYYDQIPDNSRFDPWGVLYEGAGDHHFTIRHPPMADFDSTEQIASYPFPDLDREARYRHLPGQVEEAHRSGFAFACSFGLGPIQTLWNLRGMDKFMIEAATGDTLIRALYDRVVDLQCAAARHLALAHPDMIFNGDNCATQRGLMVGRPFWRDWYGAAHKRIISVIKDVDPSIKYYYHADGMVQELLPDMIDTGIDIFDPVQPECMDPAAVKDAYGDAILFSGAISVQKTLPFGTPDDVRAEVKLRMKTIGKGGGYFIKPSHTIGPEVPWENIMAFVDACYEYGRY